MSKVIRVISPLELVLAHAIEAQINKAKRNHKPPIVCVSSIRKRLGYGRRQVNAAYRVLVDNGIVVELGREPGKAPRLAMGRLEEGKKNWREFLSMQFDGIQVEAPAKVGAVGVDAKIRERVVNAVDAEEPAPTPGGWFSEPLDEGEW